MVLAQRRLIVLGLLCALFAAVINVGTAELIRRTLGAATSGNTRLLGFISLFVIGVFFLKYWFSRGQSYFLTKAAHRLTADLRKKLFAKLQQLPLAYFHEKKIGNLQSILTNDVAVVQSGLPLIRDFVDSPVLVIGGIGYMFFVSWQLTLVSLLAIPPIAYVILTTSRKVRREQSLVQQSLGEMGAMMQESLSGVRVVKSFAAEDREMSRFGERVEENFSDNMRVVRRVTQLRPLVELIGAVAVAGILWYGGTLVAHGALRVEGLMAFVFAVDRVVRGATGLGNIGNIMGQVRAAVDRIYSEVLDAQSEAVDENATLTIRNPRGHISLEGVGFVYPDGTRALEGVTLDIEPGTSVALVGGSGAGKSTLADLLLKFYRPTEGVIRFDGTDINELDTRWLREQFGVVPQQTLLFAGTVAENIAFGKPEATLEEIREAAARAHALEFIEAMPNGFDTMIGERGVRLSGGEMQRIAIARALLVNPKVLLLDEATSALDAVSEKKVQEALERVMHERTTILIAHRLTTAARADRIVVLHRGKLVETGSHEELMKKNGYYATMYRAFSEGIFDGSL
jgi:subfamily B ATP-binding cassette protein MsbA